MDEGKTGSESEKGGNDPSYTRIHLYLRGLDYPADHERILDTARSHNAPPGIIEELEQLPPKLYNYPTEIDDELRSIALHGEGIKGGAAKSHHLEDFTENRAAKPPEQDTVKMIRREETPHQVEMGKDDRISTEAEFEPSGIVAGIERARKTVALEEEGPPSIMEGIHPLKDYLKGLEFPASKKHIVRMARDHKAPRTILTKLERIPDRHYDSQKELNTVYEKENE